MTLSCSVTVAAAVDAGYTASKPRTLVPMHSPDTYSQRAQPLLGHAVLHDGPNFPAVAHVTQTPSAIMPQLKSTMAVLHCGSPVHPGRHSPHTPCGVQYAQFAAAHLAAHVSPVYPLLHSSHSHDAGSQRAQLDGHAEVHESPPNAAVQLVASPVHIAHAATCGPAHCCEHAAPHVPATHAVHCDVVTEYTAQPAGAVPTTEQSRPERPPAHALHPPVTMSHTKQLSGHADVHVAPHRRVGQLRHTAVPATHDAQPAGHMTALLEPVHVPAYWSQPVALHAAGHVWSHTVPNQPVMHSVHIVDELQRKQFAGHEAVHSGGTKPGEHDVHAVGSVEHDSHCVALQGTLQFAPP